MIKPSVWGVLIFFLNVSCAVGVELHGELTQGGLIRGKLGSGAKLWLDDKHIAITPNGEFAFGFGRDADSEHLLKWQLADGSVGQKTLILNKREYQVQRIEGVPQAMVTPPDSVLERIKNDSWLVYQARQIHSQRSDFTGSFITPLEGRVTGVYGSQRIYNGTPKRPHYGIDIASPNGAKVVAPLKGIVTLAQADLYYSGGTIIIDHGMGINTTFLHLSKLTVKEGDRVEQGAMIGEVGSTGRSTGPHLDWRLNWFNVRLDPALAVSGPSPL